MSEGSNSKEKKKSRDGHWKRMRGKRDEGTMTRKERTKM